VLPETRPLVVDHALGSPGGGVARHSCDFIPLWFVLMFSLVREINIIGKQAKV
jgi:hypothetical protein